MILKVIVAALGMGVALAQRVERYPTCRRKNDMQTMLNCLADESNGEAGTSETYASYENEFFTAMNDAAASCEQNSGCDVGISKMGPDELLREGGLIYGDCRVCWGFARKLMKLFNENTDPTIRSCIRTNLGAEITKEIQPCIKRETGIDLPFFTADEFPDFDVNSEEGDNLEAMKETIEYAIAVYYKNSKMGKSCGQDAALSFLSCFDDLPAYNLDGHCDVNQGCQQNTLQKTRCSIKNLESGACKCFQYHRVQAKRFAGNIITVLNRAAQEKTEVCVKTVKDSMVSPETGRNLLDIGKNIFVTCSGLNVEMDDMLGMACRIVKRTQSSKRRRGRGRKRKNPVDVSIVIQMVNAIIDAMTQRVSRFCHGSACGGEYQEN